LAEVDSVPQASVEESDINCRTQYGSADPRSDTEPLPHAQVGDFAEAREHRFGHDGAVAVFGIERTQKFGCPHRNPYTVNTAGILRQPQPFKPAAQVFSFKHSVSSDRAAAFAVRTGIRKQDRVTVSKKERRRPQHAGSIIGLAVQKQDGISVRSTGHNRPGTKNRPVGTGYGHITDSSVVRSGKVGRALTVAASHRSPAGMKRGFGGNNSYGNAKE
jgi:hypothetical protein